MSLWSRIKGRFWPDKGRDGDALPPINEDWAVGDLAECLTAGPWAGGEAGPDKGDVARVLRVFPGVDGHGRRGWGLGLHGWPASGYAADQFRKVTPRGDETERCEEAFLNLVKRTPAAAPAHENDREGVQ